MSNYNKTDIGSGYNTNSAINTELSNIETAVNSKVDKSGSTMTGDLDMNSKKLLNVANGTNPNDGVNLAQLLGTATPPTVVADTNVVFFTTLANAIAETTVEDGQSFFVNERVAGNGGGGLWKIVLSSTVTPNGYDIIQSTGDPTYSLVLVDTDINTVSSYGDTDTAAFTGAGLAVLEGRAARIKAEPSRTYRIEFSSPSDVIHMSQFHGNGCTIFVTGGGQFSYKNNPDSKVWIKDFTCYYVGFKNNPTTTSNPQIFVETDYLEDSVIFFEMGNIQWYALTDQNDFNSWSDNTNEARHKGIARIKGTENILLHDMEFYGFEIPLITYASSSSTHYEYNLHGHNVGTLLWQTSLDYTNTFYRYGETCNLCITNTATQKGYWSGRDIGVGRNGKNVILNDANHNYYLIIDNVSGYNCIERTCYLQSENIRMTNVEGYRDFQGAAMFKQDLGVVGTDFSENNRVVGLYYKDFTTTNQDLDFYGQDQSFYQNFYFTRNSKVNRRSIIVSRANKFCTFEGGRIDLANVAVYFSVYQAGWEQRGLTFKDIRLKDVYSNGVELGDVVTFQDTAANYRSGGGAGAIDLVFENITIDNPETLTSSNLTTSAYSLAAVDGCKIIRSEGWCDRYPFSLNDCTDVVVEDCNFRIISNGSLLTSIDRLFAATDFRADRFDFIMNCTDMEAEVTTPGQWKIRCVKEQDTGQVDVMDYWTEAEFELTLPTNTNFVREISLGDKSSKLLASFGNSQLELAIDGATPTSTQLFATGTEISHTDQTTAFRIYNTGTGKITIRTDSTSLTGGILRLKIVR